MISPETVERDPQTGEWLHSIWLKCVKGQSVSALPEAAEMEFYPVWFETDAPQELQDAYADSFSVLACETEPAEIISKWEPTAPDGDGWFLIGIYNTEDGFVAPFTRPKGN